jgi:hypothetical protein
MSTTASTAPRPTPETPLYPYGTMLADAEGYLYDIETPGGGVSNE